MGSRVVVGRAGVARELRAAEALAERLRAPLTARAPWLTAALNVRAARRGGGTPVAVVVDVPGGGGVDAAAFLHLRRRGPVTSVTLLGDGVAPLPGGRPTGRLPAADEDAADRLADGIAELLGTLRWPWSLRLAGLPLGDPTARRLAARFPAAKLANDRSTRLVDELDGTGPVSRSRDPRELEHRLPLLLEREGNRRARAFLRAAARLHAATGSLEVAVVPGGSGTAPEGCLLTLLDGGERWPWWAAPGTPGLRTEPGSPLVSLTVPARSLLPAPDVARRLGVGRR
ncbi:hypothetical protein [Candidatus Blastococcus massiliensis]|uniref:hypothetical protein n=1 Tax=Candidatus Blastococcus massiliensis TaxID=1470358 RepID=UPI00058BBBBC|nr:hypothetical protein [Candidatus Blastococcus massiliensis]